MYRLRKGVLEKIAATLLAISFFISPLGVVAQDVSPEAQQEMVPPSEETTLQESEENIDAGAPEESSKPASESAEQPMGEGIEDPPPESLLAEEQEPDPIFGPERQTQKNQLKVEPDQFDGSLRYEYPLTLPPGRNGMTPDLVLSYSSKNTEQISPFGYGWSVSIPYIERLNKEGLHKLYTGDYFFSSIDGELKATTTPGMGGSMVGTLEEEATTTESVGAETTLELRDEATEIIDETGDTTTHTDTTPSVDEEISEVEVDVEVVEATSTESVIEEPQATTTIPKKPRRKRPPRERAVMATTTPETDNALIEVLELTEATSTQLVEEEPTATSTHPFSDLLEGLTSEEKAQKKAAAILKHDLRGHFKAPTYGLDIEIVDFEIIEGGVRVFARAWMGDEQLGFGKDGSVDVERINMYNPPILVDDSDGDIVRQWTDPRTGEPRERRLREDPLEAFRQSLSHTISVIGKTNTNIVLGKVGNTTSTFYPLVDGYPNRDILNANAQTWSDFRGDAGTHINTTSATLPLWNLQASNDANRFMYEARPVYTFDTSAIPDNDAVSSATLSLYGTDKSNGSANWTGSEIDVCLVAAMPDSDTALVASDFSISRRGTSLLADRLAFASYSTSTYNNFTFNASGTSTISITGKTSLGTLMGATFDNTDPGDGADQVHSYAQAYSADQTGTASDPKLVVVHSVDLREDTGTGEGYGALIDQGSFNSYEFVDGDYWKMKDKTGTVYRFGKTANEQIVNSASASQIYRWSVDEIRDTNGNYIVYSYFKNGDYVYPHKISYTNHASSSSIYEVEFFREARNDAATSSVPGFPILSKFRINEIQVKVNGIPKRVYALGYGTGDNGSRSMLTSITESGVDDTGATTTLPAVNFGYTTKAVNWTYNANWHMPVAFVDDVSSVDIDWGARFDDFNGDGWTDIASARDTASTTIYFNNGDGTWSTTTPTGLNNFVSSAGADLGTRSGDVDGDGWADIFQNDDKVKINSNRGASFSTGSDWLIPSKFVHATDNQYWDRGGRLVDVNGDGLPDFIKHYAPGSGYTGDNGVFLNNGTGWSASSTDGWSMPEDVYFAGIVSPNNGTDLGTRLADFNGDGLTDILQSRDADGQRKNIFINDGDGTWSMITPPSLPTSMVSANGADQGYRVVDVNSDGLADIVHTGNDVVYINQGGGMSFDSEVAWGTIVPDFFDTSLDRGARFVDIDADGIVDIVRSYAGTASPAGQNGAYLGNGVVPDLLQTVTTDAGGTIAVSYKPSPQYVSGAVELNPRLPMVLQTVEAIGTNNGFGVVGTTTYSYGGGEYYYENEFERKFAGFATTTITDPSGFVTNIYAHQGNGTQSTIGEYADSKFKIGKPYRTEVYDGSGNLYSKQVDKWETATTTNDRVFLKRTRSTDFTYDGDSDHKDRATTYVFDDTIGNLSLKTELGQVTGSDDGSYTDTGSDTRTTSYAYATNTTEYIYALPMSEAVKNNGGTKVAERKFYYDSLSHGSVSKGNLTNQESWITGSTYASTTKTYNGYGLVTAETDPRGKITTMSYESANIHVATTTNPLSQVTNIYRDTTSGKPKKIIDPNGLSVETVFDGLDRVTAEKIPDHLGTPTNTVTKTAYTYTDTAGARKVQKTDYLNAATSSDSYSYFDGFGRLIQERREAETDYNARDVIYNALGRVDEESVPYTSVGSARTTAAATSSLYTSYTYDPMQRITQIVTGIGTTTFAFDDWSATTTDAEGNLKGFVKDAYGNLARVNEQSGGTHTTVYTWDAIGNLTKITDPLANIRNFTYDGLGRRLTAEDLHAAADGTYGTWTYVYDDAGNATQVVDPKAQTVNRVYDDINRPTSENYTGDSGTEITYTYDTCTYGVGKLCASTMQANVTSLYDYDALGLVASTSRIVLGSGGGTYNTRYVYDRLGQTTLMTHPDSSQTRNTHNGAGLLESVEMKKSGGAFGYIVSQLDYSPTNQVTTMVYGNGATTTNTYDSTKQYRMTNKATTNSAGFKLQEMLYALDDVNNIFRITDTSNTATAKILRLTYDALNRLTIASTTAATTTPDYRYTYSYNSIGNLTASDQGTYTYAGTSYANPHAPTTVATGLATTTIAYDNNGNATSSNAWNYTWDYRNRLTKAENGLATSTHKYDHDNARVAYNDTTAAGTATHYGDRHHSKKQGTTTISAYVGDMLVGTMENRGTNSIITYVHTDHLGSIQVTSNASGTLKQTIEYLPYGAERFNVSPTGADNPQTYIGLYGDSAAGLLYANARHLAPGRGQFLSQDPVHLAIGSPSLEQITGRKLRAVLSDPQTLNSYSYARNNPITYSDPTGEIVPALAFGIFWTVAFLSYDIVNHEIAMYEYETARNHPNVYNAEQIAAAKEQVSDQRKGMATGFVVDLLSKPLGYATDVIGLVDDARQEWYERNPEAKERPKELMESLSQNGPSISKSMGSYTSPVSAQKVNNYVQQVNNAMWGSSQNSGTVHVPGYLPRSASPMGYTSSGQAVYCWGVCGR